MGEHLNMGFKSLAILCVLVFSHTVSAQNTISNTLTTSHVPVSGTKISMVPPGGFGNSASFNGFHDPENTASIMVVEMPASFKEIEKSFTREGLEAQGVRFISSEEYTVNELPAVLVEVEQTAYDILFTKYILAFGTDTETIMINGMFPKELGDYMASKVKLSILSVVYDSDKTVNPLGEMKFTMDVAGTKLKYATVMANAVLYTVDGKVPTESNDKTFFSAGSSLGEIEFGDKKQYAINRMKQMATIDEVNPEKITNVKIGGLEGYEMFVYGTNKKSGKEELVYYVMLFEDKTYYLLVGIAETNYDENLALFKRVAKTFNLN